MIRQVLLLLGVAAAASIYLFASAPAPLGHDPLAEAQARRAVRLDAQEPQRQREALSVAWKQGAVDLGPAVSGRGLIGQVVTFGRAGWLYRVVDVSDDSSKLQTVPVDLLGFDLEKEPVWRRDLGAHPLGRPDSLLDRADLLLAVIEVGLPIAPYEERERRLAEAAKSL